MKEALKHQTLRASRDDIHSAVTLSPQIKAYLTAGTVTGCRMGVFGNLGDGDGMRKQTHPLTIKLAQLTSRRLSHGR